MEPQLIIMIIAGLLTLGLLGVFVVLQRGKEGPAEPDYRVLFILGATWLPVGIATGNVGLWAMGVVFLVIGLANREKWSEQTKWSELPTAQRRAKIAVIVGLTALLGLGILSYVVAR
jgi:hypothetical protein